MILGEAVRLGHADSNPLTGLKLRRDKSDKKAELSDEEIRRIQAALPDEPEWMQVSFAIALHTGCRLRRAGVPREVAMRLVNHASELVHRVYQREKVEDVVKWRDAVRFPE